MKNAVDNWDLQALQEQRYWKYPQQRGRVLGQMLLKNPHLYLEHIFFVATLAVVSQMVCLSNTSVRNKIPSY